MADINKVILVGTLITDPKTKITPHQNKISTMRLKTRVPFYDHAGKKRFKFEWHRIVVWNNNCPNVDDLRQYDRVMVDGKLATRSWEEDGKRRYVTEVLASSIDLLEDEYEDEVREDVREEPQDQDDSYNTTSV